MTNHRSNHSRFLIARRAGVLAAAIGASTFGIASLADAQPTAPAQTPQAVDLSGVADWAGTTGLSGLSPASLGPQSTPVATPSAEPVDLSGVAEWARANGLTGLSPSSLGPAENS